MKFRLHPLACSLNAALALTLAACGGGGSGVSEAPATVSSSGDAPAPSAPAPTSAGTPAPAPAPAAGPAGVVSVVTLKGTVMANQAVRNAVVCLDLNANSVCDAGEPASGPTAADGSYTISYETSKVSAAQAASASLIAAMVPGAASEASTTFDAADPAVGMAASPYVLRQVPGKAGQINPLTTLVAKGIASGMTESDARTNTAQQLKIGADKIDDYQGDPATSTTVQNNARWVAQQVKRALEAGAALQVGNQLAAVTAGPGDLVTLRYTDASNYFIRSFANLTKAAGTPGVPVLDVRTGRTTGSLNTDASLYNFAYLSSSGWRRCDGPWEASSGTPSRSDYCGGGESVGFTIARNLEGQSMAALVTELGAETSNNLFNNGVSNANLVAALGAATFPAGSFLNERHTLALTPSIFINSLTGDGRPQGESQKLEDLIATKQAAGAALPGTGGSLPLGLAGSNVRALRVAFTGVINDTSGTVQFYECDIDVNAVQTNCAARETGTYSIGNVNGVRVMRFAGHAPTVLSQNRVYVEVQNSPSVASGNWVYQARESKMETAKAASVAKRLNATAGMAIKAQLGL